MKEFFERVKARAANDLQIATSTDEVAARTVLLKWGLVGLLLFLSILFNFLHFSLTPQSEPEEPQTEAVTPEADQGEAELEVDEGPLYDVEEDLPLAKPSEEEVLKESLWTLLMRDEFQQAADEAYALIQAKQFDEAGDFMDWYHDINLVGVVPILPVTEQADILTSFKTPRFQAIFPTYSSVLTLATVIEDPESLLPLDVQTVQLVSEKEVAPQECEGISAYMDSRLVHFKSVYVAEVLFNEELLTAYVGVFNNGHVQLLGYFGESSTLKTDAYWETKRLDYANNPLFQ